MARERLELQNSFELFDAEPTKLKAMVDYAAASFPSFTFITQSVDGGLTWEVVR